MKTQLEQPPIYVESTPEQWADAKASVARKQMTPFFAMGAGYRRSAMRAAVNSGAMIRPEIAVEFRTTLDAEGYRPRNKINLAEHKADEARKLQQATDYQTLLKQQQVTRGFESTQHARAVLGPIGFAHFSSTPEGKMLQKLERNGFQDRFNGR